MSTTYSDFWNGAFLAALHRLPAAEAEKEANNAIEIAIAHWQKFDGDFVATSTPRTDMDVAGFPRQLRHFPDISTKHL